MIPIRLLEYVSRWDFVGLPIFRATKEEGEEKKGLAETGRRPDARVSPLLPPCSDRQPNGAVDPR